MKGGGDGGDEEVKRRGREEMEGGGGLKGGVEGGDLRWSFVFCLPSGGASPQNRTREGKRSTTDQFESPEVTKDKG